jgi:hypothetical protein
MFEDWMERMLPLAQEGPQQPPGRVFAVGQLLTARKSGRRATVAFSCAQWTILDYGRSSHRMSTSRVVRLYSVT